MTSRCVTPDNNCKILTECDQNRTPIKLGKRLSRLKEKELNCLCCGISLYGAGSAFNTKTHNGLAEKISKLLQLNVDFNRKSIRVCKTCFRRVDSLDKRAYVLAADLEEFKCKYNTTEQLDIDKENVGYLHQETTYVKRMSKETKSPSKRKQCWLSMCDRQSRDSVESEVTINNVGEFSVKV